MVDKRKKLLANLYIANPTEEEQILAQLTIERICADMCDFYENFYEGAGPGAMVYVPTAEKESDSMFYLTVSNMIQALEDCRKNDLEGPDTILQKAISRAEALDPVKEALFIIQDEDHMSLIHYNREKSVIGPIIS